MPEPVPNLANEHPQVAENQLEQVEQKEHVFTVQDMRESEHHFRPARGLPVTIDFTDPTDPYELAQEVVYDNGIVRVTLEKGFKWDGASIPIWIPILPWAITILMMQFWDSQWVWVVTAVMFAYTLRLLPYLQKIGLHSRATCVHDKLCRAQKVQRIVADAVMESIMEYDHVPRDIRWLIHREVRNFGWWAWIKNKRALRAKIEAAKDVQVTKPEQSP